MCFSGFDSDMEIKACPRCGSTNIYLGNLSDGVLTGFTSRQVCRNCGFQGMPLIFSNEKDYKTFLKEVKATSPSSVIEETPVEKEQEHRPPRPKGLFLLIVILFAETIISLILFSIYPMFVQAANVPGIAYLTMFVLTGIIVPIGILTDAQWTFTIAGILFIFTIPINLPLLYYITRPHVKNYLIYNRKRKRRN